MPNVCRLVFCGAETSGSFEDISMKEHNQNRDNFFFKNKFGTRIEVLQARRGASERSKVLLD